MKFTKMQGIGNDYVYVDCTGKDLKDPNGTARYVSDRHFGIGSDGLILIKHSDVADFRMDMYNADGSRGEMCGNGIRCVGKYVRDYGLTEKDEISVETLAGIKYLKLTTENGKVSKVRVNMGEPILSPGLIPVKADREPVVQEPIEVCGREWKMTCVSMGNPHAVIFMDTPVKEFALDEYRVYPGAFRRTDGDARVGTGSERNLGLRDRRLCGCRCGESEWLLQTDRDGGASGRRPGDRMEGSG